MPAHKKATKPAVGRVASAKKLKGFTEEEREAMKDRVREMKGGETEGESAVLAKIAGMPEPDRAMGSRIHAIIRSNAPDLTPRLWYGMPAYTKDDKVVLHFQPAHKFKTRYATIGFSDRAHLDQGGMWPNAFALKELTADEEARIAELVRRAVS